MKPSERVDAIYDDLYECEGGEDADGDEVHADEFESEDACSICVRKKIEGVVKAAVEEERGEIVKLVRGIRRIVVASMTDEELTNAVTSALEMVERAIQEGTGG